jgi:hypothetical protein
LAVFGLAPVVSEAVGAVVSITGRNSEKLTPVTGSGALAVKNLVTAESADKLA